MSYCRFSSNNFQCDVYAYGVEGKAIEVHVAEKRHKTRSPKWGTAAYEKWFRANKRLQRIGGPFDGKCFVVPDEREFYRLLCQLVRHGYRLTPGLLKSLREPPTGP